MMLTPPCGHPQGPARAGAATTCAPGKRPAQICASAHVQWSSCKQTMAPPLKCAITASRFARPWSACGLASHRVFQVTMRRAPLQMTGRSRLSIVACPTSAPHVAPGGGWRPWTASQRPDGVATLARIPAFRNAWSNNWRRAHHVPHRACGRRSARGGRPRADHRSAAPLWPSMVHCGAAAAWAAVDCASRSNPLSASAMPGGKGALHRSLAPGNCVRTA